MRNNQLANRLEKFKGFLSGDAEQEYQKIQDELSNETLEQLHCDYVSPVSDPSKARVWIRGRCEYLEVNLWETLQHLLMMQNEGELAQIIFRLRNIYETKKSKQK